MLNALAPELAHAVPGQLRAGKLPQLEIVIQIGAPLTPGAYGFDQIATMGGGGRASPADRIGRAAAV